MKLETIIARGKIELTCARTDSNPNMTDSKDMDHWACVLSSDTGEDMELFFSMGRAHNGRIPEVSEVLDCLASDAATVINARDFADWCSELGYDSDSRKAEATYRVSQAQAESLKRLMGGDFDLLLYDTERL